MFRCPPPLFSRLAVACRLCPICLLAGAWSPETAGHGGVVLEEDLCIIQLGFFKAHFTIYQPETSANREFCEDIPAVTDTVFVMDYLHNSMREVPVDFRIIKDVTDLGNFARWGDVAELDLESATVFYQPPVIKPEAVFTVEHEFLEPGQYIGIVTTQHPSLDKTYNTVFPFRVGGGISRYWLLFIAAAALIQAHFLVSSGALRRLRAWLKAR